MANYSKEELQYIASQVQPHLLELIKSNGLDVDAIEVVEDTEGITSLPAYDNRGGTRKVVRVPLSVFSKPATDAAAELEEYIAKANAATESANTAADNANAALGDINGLKDEIEQAVSDAQQAVTDASSALEQTENKLAEMEQSEQERAEAEQARADAEESRAVEYATLKDGMLTAIAQAEAATDNANDTADHPTYIGEDHYVYKWNKTAKAYDKTDIYVKGEAFSIRRVWKSVAEKDADNTKYNEGDFGLINTNDVENPDNAQLYVYHDGAWEFLVDMSGAIGFTGKTPQLSIGSVSGGAEASVTLSEDGVDADGNPKYKLNLVLPKGEQGDQGFTPVFEMGTTVTLEPGSQATATLTPNGVDTDGNPKYLLNLSIPRGQKGENGEGSGNVLVSTEGLTSGKTYLFSPSQDGSAEGEFVEYEVPEIDTTQLVTKTELEDALEGKQDSIDDLATIRSGASKGSTALQDVPLATETVVGGFKAAAKTEEYTEEVRMDNSTGKAYVKPSFSPDEEDITAVSSGNTNVLKLKNRDTSNGMGYIILRKDKTAIEQMTEPKTIYEIRYDFDLDGETLEVPEGCVLDFKGGSFSNGKINLKLTSLISSPCRVFKDVELAGKLNVDSILLEWFGAKGDGITDDTDAWLSARQYLNNNGGCLLLLNKTYALQPLDLVGLRNVSIRGGGFAKSPWKITTCIKIISEGAVGIRCTGDYQEEPVYDSEGNVTTKGGVPTEYATAVSLKDFYLNCNKMVQKGINCHYNVEIDSVEVRNSINDGIVLEATTYPVRLRNVQTFSNGGDGLRVVAQNTTVYTIDGLESWGNGGYGLHIEGGNSCVIKNAILQSNKTGGLLMIQRNNSDFTRSQWLGSLLFENMYTEANGTLDESDEGYDGNYAIKIIGLSADRSFTNKIDSITFLNCKTSASATGKTSLIEGTSNIRLIGSLGFSIDYEKNVEYSIGTTRTENLRIGDLNNTPLKRYHVQNNETYYLKMTTATDAIETNSNSFHIQIVGTRINAIGCLDYTITGNPVDEFVKFEIRAFKYGMFQSNPKKMICGRGYISGKLSDGSTYRKEIILEAEPYSQLVLYLRDAAGKNIYPTELPTSGTVNLTMFYPSTSSFS